MLNSAFTTCAACSKARSVLALSPNIVSATWSTLFGASVLLVTARSAGGAPSANTRA
jgi:hypothetical protein